MCISNRFAAMAVWCVLSLACSSQTADRAGDDDVGFLEAAIVSGDLSILANGEGGLVEMDASDALTLSLSLDGTAFTERVDYWLVADFTIAGQRGLASWVASDRRWHSGIVPAATAPLVELTGFEVALAPGQLPPGAYTFHFGVDDVPDGLVTIPLLRQSVQVLVRDGSGLDVDRSLVVHDAATLGAGDFGLRRTVQQIVDTSPEPTGRTAEALLQDLLDSHLINSATNAESGLGIPVDVRTGEAALDVGQLLDPTAPDGMIPVALFNRFDVAPLDGSHCGEHRIVYAKRQGGTPGRFLVIFEAVVPNPQPTAGIEGCRPVADRWAALSNPALNDAQRAAGLEQLYYQGLPGFAPVVHFAHYGVPFGQVRTNLFINFATWQLREMRTAAGPLGEAVLVVDTVKGNPLAELYDGDDDGSSFSNPVLYRQLRDEFQTDFVTTQIGLLAAPELGTDPLSPASLINGFAPAFANRHNEFQSVSQGLSDDPTALADASFRATIAGAAPAGLTDAHLLNRAGAQSCGGCHQFSAGREIGRIDGSPVSWPASAGFVHVTESGALSQALTDFFLPARMALLEQFLASAPVTASSQASDLTAVLERIDLTRQQLAAGSEVHTRETARAEIDVLVQQARALEAQLPVIRGARPAH